MRRLVLIPAVLLSLLLANAAFADDDEDDEPSVFQGYLMRFGNNAVAGLNGILTFYVDPVAFAAQGDEIFEEIWASSVTGRILGFSAGLLQGGYRLLMGATDLALSPVPAMPMMSPVPRYKILPFEHEDE
jgi:hypothetical protein